ncbi:predicted protein [Lichtheimia corymbifera JMRC:FSU:9682]|uniref:Uncharacterized protein n=1 Tax=Lichtheimia corymbifera JMRC:FSU:9682 TaxID=1263082 RepID=A0A068RJR0_9FUNG|nr:predicted protein [Lichtheimia corymbifera JMRC:FSU:9682]
MHELNRPKNRSTKQQLQSKQQQQHEPKRTGLINEEQQRRIAARAAKAMEKQIRRRRDHWSLFMWGDRKKAVIKRFPDGTQEILVPQTLTPEQEHYEFPPRSRLLKKLASATAERRRMQPSPSSAAAAAAAAPSTSAINLDQQQHLPPPTVLPSMSPPKPDPLAIDKWFSSHQQQKDRDVIAWMDQIEQSKEIESNSRRSSARISIASRIPSSSSASARRYAEGQQQQQQPQPHTFYNDEIIHFRSAAGKRWVPKPSSHVASYTAAAATPLLPPPEDDSVDKHYVRSSLLRYPQQRKDEAATRIQAFWRGRHERKKPIGGMVRLVGMFHQTLQHHQRQAHNRLAQLEHELKEERHYRQVSQQRLNQLEKSTTTTSSFINKHASLTERLERLEKSLGQESIQRRELQTSLSSAVQQMNQLEKSMMQQAEHGRMARRSLQKQVDQVLLDIRSIRSSRR